MKCKSHPDREQVNTSKTVPMCQECVDKILKSGPRPRPKI